MSREIHLPHELLQSIFDDVIWRSTLSAGTLVSRRWFAAARPQLFRSLSIKVQSETCADQEQDVFARFFSEEPPSFVVPHVRALRVSLQSPITPSEVEETPVTTYELDVIISKFPALQVLSLDLAILRLTDKSLKSWTSPVSLRELRLEEVSFEYLFDLPDVIPQQELTCAKILTKCSFVQFINMFETVDTLILGHVWPLESPDSNITGRSRESLRLAAWNDRKNISKKLVIKRALSGTMLSAYSFDREIRSHEVVLDLLIGTPAFSRLDDLQISENVVFTRELLASTWSTLTHLRVDIGKDLPELSQSEVHGHYPELVNDPTNYGIMWCTSLVHLHIDAQLDCPVDMNVEQPLETLPLPTQLMQVLKLSCPNTISLVVEFSCREYLTLDLFVWKPLDELLSKRTRLKELQLNFMPDHEFIGFHATSQLLAMNWSVDPQDIAAVETQMPLVRAKLGERFRTATWE
ncbi:hypothetical protein EIP91_005071 [Steccherinum ochraceum]|uniref:Uncharacterized protein n=1 Tax=Steccherinum ochraceum TaxID=92696 RepID=A0A4R0RW72_9APHY|nr:hypothetical protein EIP91_005071 [Steccherinum ochraceum]